MTDLQLHPLCTLFPRLEGIEFEALKADIEANGLLQPIVVHEGMILDGGNRYRACIELGIEPQTTEMDFAGYDPLSYVLSCNLLRRHLTQGQHAAIVSTATNWLEAQSHGGDRRSDQVATLPLETLADRASVSGASERTQRMADKVAKADPDLAKRVAHGEISLPKAVRQIESKDSDAVVSAPSLHVNSNEQSSTPRCERVAVADELIIDAALVERLTDEIKELKYELEVANDRLKRAVDRNLILEKAADPDVVSRIEEMQRELDAMRVIRDLSMDDSAERAAMVKRAKRGMNV